LFYGIAANGIPFYKPDILAKAAIELIKKRAFRLFGYFIF